MSATFSLFVGSPVVVNGDEFENIELRRACEVTREGQIVSGGQPNRQPTPIPGSNDNATPENLTTEVDSNDNSKTRDIIELSRELSKNLQNLALQESQGSQQQHQRQESSVPGTTTNISTNSTTMTTTSSTTASTIVTEANTLVTTTASPPGPVSSLPVAPELEKPRDLSSGYGSESGDMLRELVKNKELMKLGAGGLGGKKDLPRYSSVDSDVSEGSTLVSTGSDNADPSVGERRKKARINHHTIRSTASDTEVEIAMVSSSHKPMACPESETKFQQHTQEYCLTYHLLILLIATFEFSFRHNIVHQIPTQIELITK